MSYQGRNGLIRRAWVVPANPRSASQMAERSYLTLSAQAYDALTPTQQDAWSTLAGSYQSRATLGQSGPLTGLQLFTKLNSVLRMLGEDPLTDPPVPPVLEALGAQNMTITNAAGTGVAIKLTVPVENTQAVIVRASAPQNSGVRAMLSMRVIGTLPAPETGVSDITSLYVARYGAPQAGKRLFVACNVTATGYQGPQTYFQGMVPQES